MFNYSPYIFYLTNSPDILSDSTIFFNILFLIIITIGIILLAFLTTKILAGRFTCRNANQNIRVIERHNLGLDKYLLLVEVGKNYYLIAATKNNIEIIDKIENLDIKQESNQKQFQDIFSKIIIKK